jgi:hypothetical protein
MYSCNIVLYVEWMYKCVIGYTMNYYVPLLVCFDLVWFGLGNVRGTKREVRRGMVRRYFSIYTYS